MAGVGAEAVAGTPPRLQQLLRDGWHVGLPSEAQGKGGRGTDGRIIPGAINRVAIAPLSPRSDYAGWQLSVR
jgi:hypothetical protein